MGNCLLKADGSLIRSSDFQEEVSIKGFPWKADELVDVVMDRFVKTQLTEAYTNIFIPLSLGKTLTDFLGLRLALHIRTTLGNANQLANIIIYGTFTLAELPKDNEFLSVLLTRGVILTDYSIDGIRHYLAIKKRILSEDQIGQALQSVHLRVPENYFDSHSIANVWGLFRLLDAAGIDFNIVESIRQQWDKLSGIYFKWLLAQKKQREETGVKICEKIKYQHVLLIDDEAEKGWKDALVNVLNIPEEKIMTANSVETAVPLLAANFFQLIFLDLRLDETDHSTKELTHFGGYCLLTQYIRNNFHALNFPTPVVLLTASNKAWNISQMVNMGVDDYYIKEHPSQQGAFSKENYERLINGLPYWVEQGAKRKEIWKLVLEIERLTNIRVINTNIKDRIVEKLKMGYGTLFRKSNQVEKDKLVFNNEILAYMVFWSIMEEISYDFYDHSLPYEWKLRSNGFALQWREPGRPDKVRSRFPNVLKVDDDDVRKSASGDDVVFLSGQIVGILRYQLLWDLSRIETDFMDTLNEYRNRIDFIHSSSAAILTRHLSDNQDSIEGYNKCVKMLSFLMILLS